MAEELAERSDRVAELLAAGDECGAAHAADDLSAATIAAINRGDVPAPFQEELTAAAGALVDEVNCPPPPEEDKDDGKDKDEKKDDKDEEKDGNE